MTILTIIWLVGGTGQNTAKWENKPIFGHGYYPCHLSGTNMMTKGKFLHNNNHQPRRTVKTLYRKDGGCLTEVLEDVRIYISL